MNNQRFSFLKELTLAVAPAIAGGMIDIVRDYIYSVREEAQEQRENRRGEKKQ